MSYSLKQIDDATVPRIRDEWFAQLDQLSEESAFLYSGVERIIDWCEKVLSNTKEARNCLWALCDEGSCVPRAIVEMTDARKSKDPAYKFLNIYLEPRLILDYKEEIHQVDLVEPVRIISFALLQSLVIALKNGTRKLKIYGRTDEMRSVFDNLVMTMDPDTSGANIYRQSKWLVIEAIGEI